MCSEISIERINNGYIVHNLSKEADVSERQKVHFRTLKETLEFVNWIFTEG